MRAAVVTTADNASPANDGQTSLLEALTNVQDNETISFNIPGTGPHYIVTPVTGYPLITKSGVTIDGYTQPGAAPNTAAPDQPKNAKLQIVLDSRTDQPAERRTVLTEFGNLGFGDSESCVLGFVGAPNAQIRGLSFIGVSGQDNASNPHVYCVALIEGSTGAKIQGCWFGLDAGKPSWTPGADGVVPGVAGARAAVASFHKGNPSSGLIFGTDGDGTNDRAEGNVCVAQRVAVHLQTPQVVMAGNWINLFPDGSLLDVEKQGIELEDGTMEIMENGEGTDMRVGTNGDGINDSEEANRFGPVVYDTFAEFWRSAQGIVFAGNYAGMGFDGFPAFSSPATSLVVIRENSSIRIGSDGNGISDRLEANHLYGIGASEPFVSVKGSSRISFRGNELAGSTGPIPRNFSLLGNNTTPDAMYLDFLTPPENPEDPWEDAVKLNAVSTATSVSGTYPIPLDGISKPVIDLYIADGVGLSLPEGPSVQGRYWLGAFDAASAANQDATSGKFKFDTTSLALTPAELTLLTATATYKLTDDSIVTLNFSETLQPFTAPPALGGVAFAPAAVAGKYNLSWTGGIGPFQVISSTSLTGPWAPLTTVSTQTAEITPDFTAEPRKFYRIREGASPR